ncbi:MAG: glycosyltransferase family 39 protein [Deltaproteobacteria bacterium]|nr:glycosyltransferase family 39 protein [Deltaproteobacteria bacterium]
MKELLRNFKIADAQKPGKPDLWVMGMIVVVGLFSRLLFLGSFPANLMCDEADTTSIVYLIGAGFGPPFFGLNWNSAPAVFNYMIIGSMKIFGDNIFAIRFPSALISVGTLVVFYTILRRWFQIIPSIAATVMLTFSYCFLNFSRSGWENIQFLLPGLLAFSFIEQTLEKSKWNRWILSGVFIGLTAYGYHTGKIFALTLVLYLGIMIIFNFRWKDALKLAVCILVSFIIFAPQLKTALSTEGTVRIKQVYAFSEDGLHGESLSEKIKEQAIKTLGMINVTGSNNQRYNLPGEPQVDRIVGIIFLIGLALTIFNLKKSLFWILSLVSSGLVVFFSDRPPDAARGVGMLPSIYFLVALAFQVAYNYRKYIELTSTMVLIAAIGSVAWSSHIYVKWISHENTLFARNPAVKLEEYSEWSKKLKEYRKRNAFFSVGSWRLYKDEGIPLPKFPGI